MCAKILGKSLSARTPEFANAVAAHIPGLQIAASMGDVQAIIETEQSRRELEASAACAAHAASF